MKTLTVERAIEVCEVESVREVGENVHVLRFLSPRLARDILPGQFINVKIDSTNVPLLRRPFSVYHTEGSSVDLIFNPVGLGTTKLAGKGVGSCLDVLGPLGTPYDVEGEFDTALLVAGGLGVAPLPLLTKVLKKVGKSVVTFLGGRTIRHVVSDHLENVSVATDDGSAGFRGTVVELIRNSLHEYSRLKIFACGPMPMLKNLAHLAQSVSIPCEASIECAMACGFGICQGCPVELVPRSGSEAEQFGKYALVCKSGPVFDTRYIILP